MKQNKEIKVTLTNQKFHFGDESLIEFIEIINDFVNKHYEDYQQWLLDKKESEKK